MKKKSGLGIIAALLVASAVVFANSNTTIKSKSSVCPNHPGCICNSNGKAATSTTKASKSDVCPYDVNCVCPDNK